MFVGNTSGMKASVHMVHLQRWKVAKITWKWILRLPKSLRKFYWIGSGWKAWNFMSFSGTVVIWYSIYFCVIVVTITLTPSWHNLLFLFLIVLSLSNKKTNSQSCLFDFKISLFYHFGFFTITWMFCLDGQLSFLVLISWEFRMAVPRISTVSSIEKWSDLCDP